MKTMKIVISNKKIIKKILCLIGWHKWVGPHYHYPTDVVTCNGGCWCDWCKLDR